MTINPTTIRARWDAAVANYEIASAAYYATDNDLAAKPDDAAVMALLGARSDAWDAMIATRAPDAAANAYKLRDLIREVYALPEGDDVDDIDFLQGLIDSRLVEGPSPLVWLYQDALHQAGIDHPALAMVPSRERSWAAFAAHYRRAVTKLKADFGSARDDDAIQELNDRHSPLYRDLIGYPVQSAAELAEKVELLSIDVFDPTDAFEAVAKDAARIMNAAA